MSLGGSILAFLRRITFNWSQNREENKYPFNITSLKCTRSIDMDHNVIFFIGENGTGKSTLLEAISFKCGFGSKGGSRNNIFEEDDNIAKLASIMTISWLPKCQLAFLNIIWQLEQEGKAQFIIATHSPILMAYPNAMIYNFDNDRIKQVEYEETDHYQLTKAFLNNREKFFRNLFYNS